MLGVKIMLQNCGSRIYLKPSLLVVLGRGNHRLSCKRVVAVGKNIVRAKDECFRHSWGVICEVWVLSLELKRVVVHWVSSFFFFFLRREEVEIWIQWISSSSKHCDFVYFKLIFQIAVLQIDTQSPCGYGYKK